VKQQMNRMKYWKPELEKVTTEIQSDQGLPNKCQSVPAIVMGYGLEVFFIR